MIRAASARQFRSLSGARAARRRPVAIESVEFTSGTLPQGDSSTDIMLVERLSLTAGAKGFVLDRAMMQNGILLVDNVWRRLHVAPA